MQGSVSEKIDYLEAELKKLKERVDAQEKTIKEHQKTIRRPRQAGDDGLLELFAPVYVYQVYRGGG